MRQKTYCDRSHHELHILLLLQPYLQDEFTSIISVLHVVVRNRLLDEKKLSFHKVFGKSFVQIGTDVREHFKTPSAWSKMKEMNGSRPGRDLEQFQVIRGLSRNVFWVDARFEVEFGYLAVSAPDELRVRLFGLITGVRLRKVI